MVSFSIIFASQTFLVLFFRILLCSSEKPPMSLSQSAIFSCRGFELSVLYGIMNRLSLPDSTDQIPSSFSDSAPFDGVVLETIWPRYKRKRRTCKNTDKIDCTFVFLERIEF